MHNGTYTENVTINKALTLTGESRAGVIVDGGGSGDVINITAAGVTLSSLTRATERQLDMLLDDNKDRQRCELLTNTIDRLNQKFGKRVVTVGPWTPPPGGYAGGKIAYNRIPSAEDFW